jgi:V/A-type H+-transporting ATPase subunit I
MLLSALEAYWRGEFMNWLATEAAVLCMYASALLTLYRADAWRGILFGAVWYFLGGLFIEHEKPLRRLLVLAGRLLESVYLLAINTLSFARVGAFALGHVALSSALMTLLENIHDRALAIMLIVLGNLFILVVEGLVVFVQTTRLVLFEFFIRFLHAEGRVFKPLRGPTTGNR